MPKLATTRKDKVGIHVMRTSMLPTVSTLPCSMLIYGDHMAKENDWKQIVLTTWGVSSHILIATGFE